MPSLDIVLEVIGWTGSVILVWALAQTAIFRLRVYNLVGAVILVGYNAALEVWPMAALNTATATINIINLIRLRRERSTGSTYAVIEVPPDDPYLGFLLRSHAEGIAEFDSQFTPGANASETAFLILRADETVGYVLLHDVGDGVAQIDLDYVSPRFRNFMPGEFVFHDSGLLPTKGFRRVVTSPDSTNDYYKRIGFTKEGPVYVLDLLPHPPLNSR